MSRSLIVHQSVNRDNYEYAISLTRVIDSLQVESPQEFDTGRV